MYVNEMETGFDEVITKFKPMIYHIIYKLNIKDQDGEFYQVGLIALFEAYRKYKDYQTFP
ncbi:hypothetical protein E3U55_14175 [Filobacillus milosensis]|uniref:RNA polymerase sigma-70 region 2 domain-containing protein n=1 Tax=Filobacillus milosensis TaxID=94137 RepID=A0A4Y8IDY1_9BACI|nr:hypothetical protein [Filobacillus milosensis]TFB14192.1 hypothetical protein E3U55_14175 [Filobacillus milosensis]